MAVVPVVGGDRGEAVGLALRVETWWLRAVLNAAEVAKLQNVDRATVSRWIKKGVLKGVFRPDEQQQWRIPLSSYEELVNNRESR